MSRYQKLLEDIDLTSVPNSIVTEELELSIASLLACAISKQDIFLFDREEVEQLSVSDLDTESIIEKLEESESRLHFKTSGTTGEPKLVVQPLQKLLQGVRNNQELSTAVWGYCYSCRHISGILMMLQAIVTDRPLIDLRDKSSDQVARLIDQHQITHISAPATFYKLTFPLPHPCSSVRKVSNGGEPLDATVIQRVRSSLPNVEFRNIYASTEFGSLLISTGEHFSIPQRLKEAVKIVDEEILVHKSLVSESAKLEGSWYHTNDLIEWTSPTQFLIKGRASEDVKVLGHLVSLRKVEQKIGSIAGVQQVRVSATTHSVFGSLLIAEVVMEADIEFDKKQLKGAMKAKLRDYEVPSKIKEVTEIKLTSSGKMSRV